MGWVYVYLKKKFCLVFAIGDNMVETRNVCLASNLPTLTDYGLELGV